MSTAETHPDVDELAEHAEGLLDGPADARVAAHLAGCADCRARVDALDRVRAELRAAPPVSMPPDVAARLGGALAGAPVRLRRRWYGDGRVLGAAAVLVLLAAGVAVGFVTAGGGGSSHQKATSAAGGSRGFTQTASGRDYDATTLATALPQLLGVSDAAGSAAGAAEAAPSPARNTFGTAGTAGGAAPLHSASEPPISRLTQPAALLDCVSNLAPHSVPLAVDIARFAGRPAAVIVLPSPGHPRDVDVWVVGASCSHAQDDLIYWARLPRPAG